MIMKSLAAAVLAGAVALVSTAAQAAYPAPDGELTCTTATVYVTTTFTCTIASPAGTSATLVATTGGDDPGIAGVTAVTKAIASSDTAVFTISAPSTATQIAFTGEVNGVATNAAAVTVTTEPVAPPASGGNFNLAIGAGVLLAAGATVLVVARRRSQAEA